MNNVIYTAIDSNYENYARACFNSIEKNYPDHPEVLVYHRNPSDSFRQFISTMNNFRIRPYNQTVQFSNLGPVNNSIVYLKYLLWSDVEFNNYDKVLHLDCDTLILQPLDYLFEGDDFLIFDNNENTKSFTMFSGNYENLVRRDNVFGNAGIFMVPRRYRTISHYNALHDLTDVYSKQSLYADQSIINIWCLENNIPINRDTSYNFQPHFFSYESNELSIGDIKIIHFAAKKPDTIEFALWWRVGNGIAPLLRQMYEEYLYV